MFFRLFHFHVCVQTKKNVFIILHLLSSQSRRRKICPSALASPITAENSQPSSRTRAAIQQEKILQRHQPQAQHHDEANYRDEHDPGKQPRNRLQARSNGNASIAAGRRAARARRELLLREAGRQSRRNLEQARAVPTAPRRREN